MKRLLLCFIAFVFCGIMFIPANYASEMSPSGFYYPLKDDSPNYSDCGKWLERCLPNGCYTFYDKYGKLLDIYHIGVDIMANQGMAVYAIADGEVISTSYNGWTSGGTENIAIIIEHYLFNGKSFSALYGHIKKDSAKKSGTIKAGEKIGEIGDWNGSGDHLHFGILTPGLTFPIDGSSIGRWPDGKYGVMENGYYDNGFIDPIWFITHNSPDNMISRADTSVPDVITIKSPWFCEKCIKSYDSRCDGSDITSWQECVLEDSTLCSGDPSSWSALAGGYSSGNTKNAGGDVGFDIKENLPDLKTRNIDVYHNDSLLLTERQSFILVGDIINNKITLISLNADCSAGIEEGKDTVETDIYYKIALGDDLGEYKYYGRVYTEVYRLYEDNHHNEYINFTVPPEAAGQRIYIRAKADSTGEVSESNESNNWSGTDEWYPVSGSSDIIISYAGLTKGRITLLEGEHYGFEAIIKNIGTTPAPMSTRLAYYEKKPGETAWTLKTTDGTDVADLIPGKENYEYTTEEPFIADTPGTHYLMVCADYLQAQPETNEDNNCLTIPFEVTAYRPNFVVDEVGLTNGRTVLKLGDKFGLYQTITNIGNAPSPKGIRNGYYVLLPGATAWIYYADDGTDAAELCVNCSKFEYTTGEPFIANKVGVWNIRGKADYQGAVLELNESDNINSNTFTVNPIGPDFYIIDMYLIVNGVIVRNGGSIKEDSYVQPVVIIGNIGNSGIHPGFRAGYYVNQDKFRDSDGVDANQVCVGCQQKEYVSSGSAFRLGDTGTRTYRVYIDYQKVAPELDETNNSMTITFYVR